MKLKKGNLILCTKNNDPDLWWEFTVCRIYKLEALNTGKLGVLCNRNEPIEVGFFERNFFKEGREAPPFLGFKLFASTSEEIE